MNLEDIKKSLTDEQIISILTHLGSSSHRINSIGNEIIFETICHHKKNEKKKLKLYYYKSSHSFYCYSSCNAIGDIFRLASHVLNLNLSEATKYVLKYFNISDTFAQPFTEEDFNFSFGDEEDIVYKSISLDEVEVESLIPIKNQNIMRRFVKYYCKEWLNEKITKESMDKYGIAYSIEKNAVVIPHFDINNQIVGIRVRHFDSYDIENYGKYTPLFINNKMYNHQLSRNVYGLDKSIDSVKKYKKVILFEGEKSCLILDSWYNGDNPSVAVCGSNISIQHLRLILDNCGEDIEFIIAFDKQWSNEEEEIKWRKKIERMCKPLLKANKKVSVIWDRKGLLNHKEAPVDQNKKVFEILLKDREELILEEDK